MLLQRNPKTVARMHTLHALAQLRRLLAGLLGLQALAALVLQRRAGVDRAIARHQSRVFFG